jgi:hypothetical protein
MDAAGASARKEGKRMTDMTDTDCTHEDWIHALVSGDTKARWCPGCGGISYVGPTVIGGEWNLPRCSRPTEPVPATPAQTLYLKEVIANAFASGGMDSTAQGARDELDALLEKFGT